MLQTDAIWPGMLAGHLVDRSDRPTDATRTVPVAIALILPVLVFQRRIAAGLTAGAVKR